MEKLFQLKKHNTNVRTEVIGGLTTFFAMAYIIFVNPNFLSQTGMDHTAVMLATCVSAAIGCFLTAFMANVPFAQAPGMGLNAFFTYTICFGMGYTWQQGLAIVFISGLIFLAISISPIRKQIIDSIPAPLKAAISAGIGLFICLIGLLNAGIVTAGNNLLDLSSITSGPALLALIGLIITGILMAWKVKGALFIGILVTTVIGIPMGVTNLSNVSISFEGISIAPTFFKLSFVGLLSKGILPLLTAIVTFAMCDCFDTVGTLIGTAGSAGMLDENGNLPRGDKALIADAVATCTGALMGTSTVTTFVESSTGISEGGRTGLTALVTGIMFLLTIFLAPLFVAIPYAATGPALIYVGFLMLKGFTEIDFTDFDEAIGPCVMMMFTAFTGNITNGLGAGIIVHVLVKLVRGKAKEIHPIMYLLCALMVLYFIVG